MAVTRITTQLIKDLAITTVKLAANAVTLGKLGALSTKGQIVTHDGSNHTALGVGTNGQVLTANSAATNGIEWATPAAGATNVYSETPTGTVNGTNDTFTLANTPTSGTLRLYLNGVRMNAGSGNDYVLTTNSIVFEATQIPQTGDVILADYSH